MRHRVGAGLRHVRANAIAYVALFAALGGTSAYAAGALPKASVGTKQLKRDAVTSVKVKDGSLSSADFATGQMPGGATGAHGQRGPQGERGAQGERGTTGPQGPRGERGEAGISAYEGTIPSGTTVSGFFFRNPPIAKERTYGFGISLPAPAPHKLTASNVNYAADSDPDTIDDDPACTGSAEEPTAPAGKVCLYAEATLSVGTTEAAGFENRHGFVVFFNAESDLQQPGVYGTWAYTAP